MGWLKFLPAILSVITLLKDWYARSLGRREGRQEVINEINAKEVENAHEASRVLAQSRDDSDLERRLRDGTF